MRALFLAVCLAAVMARAGVAGMLIETDANVLTAIDESASVGRHGEWLQYNGLAAAVTDPSFLEAVLYGGDKRRVGFAVVAWSSDGRFREILPWMVIASEADAALAADLIRRAPRKDRSDWDAPADSDAPAMLRRAGGDTDMSATIDAAVMRVVLAPFAGGRGVINILANGRDNVGNGPGPATQRAVALGMTVNGVAFGDDDGLPDYFRRHVIGGIGCFVESVDADPQSFNETMVRKLLQDLLV